MYSKLLVTDRIRESTRGSLPLLQAVESDRARVIYSKPFRRLQRKAQVFPLEDNAAVRTRLTHSLEVSNVGRYLATTVLRELSKSQKLSAWELDGDNWQAFVTTVETACLLHDIGNPPFGHFGEAAISQWFKNKKRSLKWISKHGVNFKNRYSDFLEFDGNPQGFRIVTRLAGEDPTSGLNLTYGQIATTVKYPYAPHEKEKFGGKKAGLFLSEYEIYERVWAGLELKKGHRHPLAYLMEAADDISYCLSDIEDGIEKEIITFDQVAEGLRELIADPEANKILEQALKSAYKNAAIVDRVVIFRSTLINKLVEYTANKFIDIHQKLLDGYRDDLIDKSDPYGYLLSKIKEYVRGKVYTHRSAESIELGGLAVISGLLEKYGALLDINRSEFESLGSQSGEWKKHGLDVEKRLYDFLGRKHLNTYKVAVKDCKGEFEEWWLRAHLVIDHISGMTDAFALQTYQILSGIKL